MDGKRIQNYWSNEMQAMLDTYKQFRICSERLKQISSLLKTF